MKRTNTTTTQVFDLPFPKAAIFDFTSQAHITVEVPAGSKWRMPFHWHTTTLDGRSLVCRGGNLQISTNRVVESGGWAGGQIFTSTRDPTVFDITEHVTWGSSWGRGEWLKVEYQGSQILHLNICSAILDRDIYPQLDTTPFWIAAVFRLLSYVRPSLKNWLLDKMLNIQLEMIYYRHDFNLYHGGIWFHLPWLIASWGHGKPPRWTLVAFVWSIYLISKIVMMTNFWLGRIFLGMKGEYLEYTPSNLKGKDD